MSRDLRFGTHARLARCALLAFLGAMAALPAAPRVSRLHLLPKFTAGETVRYRIETHTTTTQQIVSPIVNPQGGSNFSQTISLLVRLDVLGAQPSAPGAAGAARLRATYEKSQSDSRSDAFDPATPSPDSLYNSLAGHSFEFMLGPEGQLSDFKGLEDIFPDRSQGDPVLSWLKLLSPGASFPPEGVAIGQKWTSELPLNGVPLAGLAWRAQSTYLRDEPCAAPVEGACAVILTHLEIFRHGSADSDATPEDYRRNGLRTSGTWTGTGESLDSISVATGLLVSSTQTGTQKMDYQISSASTGSKIHRTAQMDSQSEVTLAPASP